MSRMASLSSLPPPRPVQGPRPLSCCPPRPCLQRPSWECSWGLHGPLTRPAKQSGEPGKEMVEMLGGGPPGPRPPRGYPQPLMPKGTSFDAKGVSPAALAGPPHRSYLVGGGRGFFHGRLPFLPCALLVWLHPMITALPLLA